jgi:type III secretion protein Q
MELQGYGLVDFRRWDGTDPGSGADVQLTAEAATVHLRLPTQLVARVVGRATGTAPRFDAGGPLSDSLLGAMHAVVAELCRQVAVNAPMETSRAKPRDDGWQVQFWVRLDDVSYRGSALLSMTAEPRAKESTLSHDHALIVGLPMVIGLAESTPALLQTLRIGDVFSFGPEMPPNLAGSSATLCAPCAERGLHVALNERGVVLRGPCNLDYEPSLQPGGDMSDADEHNSTADTIEQAPVVVRVELGSVTMSVAQWLDLSPGEVLTTDIPLGAPAVLRVAGRELASGELVNVDGRVGVRIKTIRRDGAPREPIPEQGR